MKRALDLLGAVGLLVLTAPLLGLIALLVRATHGRPVLFAQRRPGLHGRPFTLYKFRTMRPLTAERLSGADAERLTPFGRWLRSTSLDELPELWNIVRGDMSFVGPRPLLMEYLPLYNARQSRRHEVRPGLTGWAQINGRNAVSWPERLEMDVWYVDHQSLLLDIRILFLTIGTVLGRRGIAQQGQATMEPFRGEQLGEEEAGG